LPESTHAAALGSDGSASHPVAHQFDTAEQQYEASQLGMWIFLANEIMFFGGVLAAFLVSFVVYAPAFEDASNHLSLPLGALNTVVLLTSSLTMALAVHAAQVGERRQLVRQLVWTLLLGSVFLVVKAYEYSHKFHEGLVPGPSFAYSGRNAAEHELFLSFYFALTGLHARSRCPASTGTSSTWSGSSCFPCSICWGGTEERPAVSSHVLPVATYRRIFRILIALTIVTVIVSFIDLGVVNPIVALLIAFTKAYLVVSFFMHLKFLNRLTRTIFLTGVFAVILLFAIALDDELTRTSTTYLPSPPVPAEGVIDPMGLDGVVTPRR
jgi:cytochrome c oxidase subunit 3